jgi:nucleoid-associated protein YgaU
MTKETKIGLLVGLAFIILFAIILSEKGATRGTSPPSSLTLADSSAKRDRPGDAPGPLADAGRLPVESSLPGREPDKSAAETSPRVAASKKPAGQPIPDEGDPLAPLPKSVVQRLNQPVEGTGQEAAPADSTDETGMTLEEAVAAALEIDPETTAPGGSGVSPSGHESRQKGAASGAEMVAAGSGSEASGNPAVVKAVHLVEPGESLGKIAARHYGRATPARIAAIFEANRGVLKSINLVRANDELKIPALEGEAEALFEAAADFVVGDVVAAQSSRREGTVRIPLPVEEVTASAKVARKSTAGSGERDSSARDSEEFLWYEVQERDTLSSIAKHELGNERRFLELYRLNRDLIKNKNVIRPGLRIRLPGMAGASGASDSRVVASLGDGGAGEP